MPHSNLKSQVSVVWQNSISEWCSMVAHEWQIFYRFFTFCSIYLLNYFSFSFILFYISINYFSFSLSVFEYHYRNFFTEKLLSKENMFCWKKNTITHYCYFWSLQWNLQKNCKPYFFVNNNRAAFHLWRKNYWNVKKFQNIKTTVAGSEMVHKKFRFIRKLTKYVYMRFSSTIRFLDFWTFRCF